MHRVVDGTRRRPRLRPARPRSRWPRPRPRWGGEGHEPGPLRSTHDVRASAPQRLARHEAVRRLPAERPNVSARDVRDASGSTHDCSVVGVGDDEHRRCARPRRAPPSRARRRSSVPPTPPAWATPTLTTTATSGSTMRASAAISPRRLIPTSRTAKRCTDSSSKSNRRHADAVVQVPGGRVATRHGRAGARRRAPSSWSCPRSR